MAESRKSRYRILLTQLIECDFDVTASSCADACKILQRELRTRKFRQAKFRDVIDAHWAEPSKQGQAWLVMCANDGGPNRSPIMIWDGKEVSDSGLPLPPRPVAPNAGKKKNAYKKHQ